MTDPKGPSPLPGPTQRPSFGQDFKRFFLRGLAAIMPTLITLWLLVWVWDFLWNNIGYYIMILARLAWDYAINNMGLLPFQTKQYIDWYLDPNKALTRVVCVLMSILLLYFLGIFVGNLLGRTAWRAVERGVLQIPLVRAIYPAVKQITDFVLADRSLQFQGSQVVAVQPHEQNIWSLGLVTSRSEWTLGEGGPEEMVTVFVPSTPTSFSGYVLVVPRSKVIELPMTVEEAMRLLVSGGLIMPGEGKTSGREMVPVAAMEGEARIAGTSHAASAKQRSATQTLGKTA